MKTNDEPRILKAEDGFSTVLIVVLCLILPMWGATAMLTGSLVGLAVYGLLFRERLRNRGGLVAAASVALAAALAAWL